MNWDSLVTARDQWVAKNFPDPHIPDPGESVLGCIEELGELCHHWLKKAQNIRGSQEEHDAEMKDAVGDLTIYLLGVMSKRNCRPHGKPIVSLTDETDVLFRLSRAVGNLAARQHTTCTEQVTMITYLLDRFCLKMGWNYEQIVIHTWNHVKERDWSVNREDGSPIQLPTSDEQSEYAGGQ